MSVASTENIDRCLVRKPRLALIRLLALTLKSPAPTTSRRESATCAVTSIRRNCAEWPRERTLEAWSFKVLARFGLVACSAGTRANRSAHIIDTDNE